MAQSELLSSICDPDGDITLILHEWKGAPAEEPDSNTDELENLSFSEGEETEIEPGQ